MGPRELKNLKPFVRRSIDDLLPNDIWSADGHTFDAEVQHPFHGRPFRPEITTVVDIATRRVVGFSVGLAENAIGVLEALQHGCTTAGIPAIFYVDNGSGFTAQLLKDEALGVLGRLGIEIKHSIAYNSQARGVIERLQDTLWVSEARDLPSFVGKDMDREARQAWHKLSRKELKAKETVRVMPMAWDAFIACCEAAISQYNSRPHRTLRMITDVETSKRRRQTPDERWAELAPITKFVRVGDEDMAYLFRPRLARVIRRGEIALFGNRYFARSLEEYHGDTVQVGYDIHDPRHIWVHDADGHLLAVADFNGNSRDYFPQSVIENARDKRAAAREKRLNAKLQTVRDERNGTLPHLPDQNIPAEITRFAELQRLKAERDAEALTPKPSLDAQTIPHDPDARYALWKTVDARIEAGEAVGEFLTRWHITYPRSAEWRVNRKYDKNPECAGVWDAAHTQAI
jgi:putative transposase